MIQRQIVVKALGNQTGIEDLVCSKHAVGSFHFIVWMLISSNIVTINRNAALPESYESSNCIMMTAKIRSSIIESLVPAAATLGGGFFVGVLIGYALKKVIKLVAVIVGLIFLLEIINTMNKVIFSINQIQHLGIPLLIYHLFLLYTLFLNIAR